MRDGFVMYRNQLQAAKAMPTAEQGLEFISAIADFALDGVAPNFSDPLLIAVWASVEGLLTKDAEKYRQRCERNAKNGAKGGRPKNPTEPKKADKDKEKDKDKDNIILINNCRAEPDGEEKKALTALRSSR